MKCEVLTGLAPEFLFLQVWGCVCMCSVVSDSFCDPLDCSPPGSSVHVIFQARILEWVSISSPRGSYQPRDQTHVSFASWIGRRILYHGTTLRSPIVKGYHSKRLSTS